LKENFLFCLIFYLFNIHERIMIDLSNLIVDIIIFLYLII